MKFEEPILVIGLPNTALWLARTLWSGLLLLGVGLTPTLVRERSVEKWMVGLWFVGLLLLLLLTVRAWRLNLWEIRLMEDRIVFLDGGEQLEVAYQKVSEFRLDRPFGSKSGQGALTILFEGNQDVKVPIGHEFAAMEIIQSRVDREIPGYEKQHLTIAAN